MPQTNRKVSSDEDDTERDLWGGAIFAETDKKPKKKQQFKEFDKKTRVRVKAVMNPHGGQSYNPSAKDHHKLIEEVVSEEKREIEEELRRKKMMYPHLFKDENQEK